ncbi:tol-pal system protein YbgF [Azospirillum fermentarium]|uniref:tol-pal system protein YbgF n=1 Tax=Azospirillum fermentarium TaxID=1233114 RepID=UPI002227319C|nr:tol-pal system protein YbgF [Azospirillum fermentarium]MCW2245917.1 tol-pal system protein YbgF [Azospirillum fermentarium]
MNTQSSPARRRSAAILRRAVSRHVLAGALAAAAFPVLAQDAGQWQRLERLEGTAAAMGGPVQVAELSSSLAADFEVRLQRLERMIAEVNGRNEELGYQVTQLKDRLERINSDIDFRLNSLESGKGGGLSAVAPGAPAAKAAAEPKGGDREPPADKPAPAAKADAKPAPVALPSGPPEKQYEYAFAFLRNQEYDKAEKALQEFVAKNKGNDLAGNAQFWLGETYFVQKKYTEAAVAYAEGMQKYPKNAKAADNLLKLGMSLGQLNKKTEACTAFAQLNKKFPTAAASVKRRAEAEQRRLNCPS